MASPNIRKEITSQIERNKQKNDPGYPLHGKNSPQPRLKSRKSFLTNYDPFNKEPNKKSRDGKKENKKPREN